ncbi:zinc ribbon domain-containing protein [Halomonas vilamensis]|uniref:Zinc ribbon domain-containing protein n=1 Tax=Vreelandella vilamensis TaxID=531309 RepID=A0ABU1H1R1_9GAMM|nr:zinc ribbon domain-containing protein [Halomonas vilamensis]MDR5898246.1 zinc ribbon domain-containing protein [Halomonas vilamensis]
MPIYEYECKACGHRLEKLQKISADPLKDCPACERDSLSRLISAAGFRLAGGGWYETDFKTGNKKNLAADSTKESVKESTTPSNSEKPQGSSKKTDGAAA